MEAGFIHLCADMTKLTDFSEKELLAELEARKLAAKQDLEAEFKSAVKTIRHQIDVKLYEASKALEEAIKISENSGISFETYISFHDNLYIPKSVKNKFPNASKEMKEILTAEWNWDANIDYPGWLHSSGFGSC